MRLYKTQYSFRISGNRGYDSNRVRFCLMWKLTISIKYLLIKQQVIEQIITTTSSQFIFFHVRSIQKFAILYKS